MNHLIMVPVLLPLFAGLLILLETRQQIAWRRWTGALATIAGLPVAWWLWQQAVSGDITVYRLGNWAPPFGIVLVLDRFAALMLLVTAVLAVPVYWQASLGDDTDGPNFHALFQFQLLGINGAFLTGDLFNLFVFFEVLLISSYALMMHGHGLARTRASLHYVVLNLAGSSLFLFGLGLLYAATGTLNMADMARLVANGEVVSLILLRVGTALLVVVFALKAALLPLSFWLPHAYSAASAPVAALFAIMTKVGLYALWRLWPLLLGVDNGPLADWIEPWLWGLALATLVFAALGALAAKRMAMLAAWLVLVSVGTLMAAVSVGTVDAWAAGLYYLIHSTWAGAALFLCTGLLTVRRASAEDRLVSGAPLSPVLGVLFLWLAVTLVGLPPLSGFIGKLLLFQAIPKASYWALVLLASLMVLVAFSRAGSSLFWRTQPGTAAALPLLQVLPLALLLLACLVPVVAAETLWQACVVVAQQLSQAPLYVQAVLGEGVRP